MAQEGEGVGQEVRARSPELSRPRPALTVDTGLTTHSTGVENIREDCAQIEVKQGASLRVGTGQRRERHHL